MLGDRCGLEVACVGDKALLLRGEEIVAYVFPRESLPRLGVYGYYGGHFVEVWEGERLREGLRSVVEGDEFLRCIHRVLLGVGEPAERVIRLRGKYGDPHVSLSLETRSFQVIREYGVVGGRRFSPRVRPGRYGWGEERGLCLGRGVYGVLDGVVVVFSGRRVGLVRGLTVYSGCKRVAGQEVYEKLGEMEVYSAGGLEFLKIPYRVAASLADRDAVFCCGCKVKVGLGGVWETPLWRRAGERYEVFLVKINLEGCKK